MVFVLYLHESDSNVLKAIKLTINLTNCLFCALCKWNKFKQTRIYIYAWLSVLCWDAIQESTKTHESPSVSALEEHQRQPSLFELVYFNMKDIHGHSFPPLTIKGHRNNEVLQLLSFWACAETLERLILIESKVTTAMLSRASRDEWYVCRSTGVNHLSLCRQPCKRLITT